MTNIEEEDTCPTESTLNPNSENSGTTGTTNTQLSNLESNLGYHWQIDNSNPRAQRLTDRLTRREHESDNKIVPMNYFKLLNLPKTEQIKWFQAMN